MSEGVNASPNGGRARFKIRNPQDFYGGLLTIGLALFAFWASWSSVGLPGSGGLTLVRFGVIAVPMQLAEFTSAGVFLTLSGVFLLILGLVVLFSRQSISNPQDYFGGVVLTGLALIALWATRELPGMHGFAFGPGTAPRMFAMLLMGFGVAIMAIGLLTDGPKVERYAWRGPLLVTTAVMVFSATVRPLGLVISSFITLMVASAAAEDVRWGESVIVAVALTVFCSLLFPYALGLPLYLWPRF